MRKKKLINPFDGVEVVGKVDGAEKEQNRKRRNS
jgi:hypothetical protein